MCWTRRWNTIKWDGTAMCIRFKLTKSVPDDLHLFLPRVVRTVNQVIIICLCNFKCCYADDIIILQYYLHRRKDWRWCRWQKTYDVKNGSLFSRWNTQNAFSNSYFCNTKRKKKSATLVCTYLEKTYDPMNAQLQVKVISSKNHQWPFSARSPIKILKYKSKIIVFT